MRDLEETPRRRHTRGKPYAPVAVTAVTGSVPRDLGPAFAVDTKGNAAGTVSAGPRGVQGMQRVQGIEQAGVSCR